MADDSDTTSNSYDSDNEPVEKAATEEAIVPRSSRRTPVSAEGTRSGSEPATESAKEEIRQEKALNEMPRRFGEGDRGAYMPPHMRNRGEAMEKDEEARQRQTWETLRRKLNGMINKVSIITIKSVVPEMFQLNLIRGKGLMIKAIMKAQQTSPSYTHVYAALIAVINTKIPQIGELLLKRVVFNFKRAYKRRDKAVATASVKFISHLMNQYVAHEISVLQLLAVLLEEPTNDSVEIAVNLVKEAGQRLQELSPRGLHAVFERLRGILHESDIDKRTQYIIEGLFHVRKEGFSDFPAIIEDLDLVEKDEQITFELGLDEEIDREDHLDRFCLDPEYAENEKIWNEVQQELVGSDDEDEGGDQEGEDNEGMMEGSAEVEPETSTTVSRNNGKKQEEIVDLTDQDLINLRRVIYLTIMSAASFEEGSHKLAKLKVPAGYESELANMLIECCANEKSFQKHYGLMGQRLCNMKREYRDAFCTTFADQYSTIHRLETNKLRNVGKLFASLLYADAVPWTCLACIQLSETETTSSSRIFIKILIQELAEALGLAELRNRLMEPSSQDAFSGLFPKDTPRNTRFAINYFTSIGLGSLTDDLREYLKNAPKLLARQMQAKQEELRLAKAAGSGEVSDSSSSTSSSSSGSSSSSSSGSSSSGSSSTSSSDSDSSSSDSDSSSSDSDSDSLNTDSDSDSSNTDSDDEEGGEDAMPSSPKFSKRKASPEGETHLPTKKRR